uniref:Knr4/Smi1-like domain-containing protein n=1 Tax=Oryza barthii TaxID=65489 RepID=A0A0D3H7P1_9ORYZ
MVDVDSRMAGLADPAAHAAGLRRLSTRAAAGPPSASASPRHGLHSFDGVAAAVLSHLRKTGVVVLPGLSDAEFARVEAEMGFTFPPDLLAKGALWPRCWGRRPSDPDRARRLARSAIRRAPLLVPLFDRCYLPCRPCLAGNPVFFITDDRVLCCGLDILHFFTRESSFQPLDVSSPSATPSSGICTPHTRRSLDAVCGGQAPRWIEFWSDAASDRRRRDSSSSEASTASSSSSSSGCPSPPPRSTPLWVDNYLDKLGSVLKKGGWRDREVDEMVEVTASGLFDGEEAPPADADAVLDALFLKTDRCSDSLRRAGWTSEDVSDAFGLDLRRRKEQPRPAVQIPPEIAAKVQRLAQAVARP